MAFWDRFKVKLFKGGVIASPWLTPPEKDTRGFLDAYGRIYSLFGICRRRASAISDVKWRLYKVTNGKRTLIPDHPLLTLLEYANEFQTGQEIIELHQLHSDLAGKAFWYLPRNKFGVPGEIWLLPPHRMKIVPSQTEFIKGYVFDTGKEKIPFTKEEIIWFPMPDPLNPYGGVGYAQAAAVELDSEDYAGRWNRNFFYNSARADAVLEYEEQLTEDEFNKLRLQWDAQHRGLNKAHKIAILEGGVKYKQIQVSQKDMDFSQLRKQTRENLLFTFGMPLSIMGITENVNRANAEAGDYLFAKWIVKPALMVIRNKLNEQLVPMFKTGAKVELDFDEVVPQTIEQRKELAESGVRSGYLTINEGRRLTGWDAISNGDQLLVPLNLIPTPIRGRTSPPPSKGLTQEWKDSYWQAWVLKAENYERKLIEDLVGMFNKQETKALKKLRSGAKRNLISIVEARKDFEDSASPVLIELAKQSMRDAEVLINPEPEHRSIKQEPSVEWMKTRIGWAAEEVGEQTATLLAKQLAEGLEAGESIPKLAKRVRSIFDNCTRYRSRMIARTETIMASNEGALYGYAESGVVDRAEFYPAPDACEECLVLTGEYSIEEAHGMVPVHPNCRCVWLPVV